MSAASWHLRPMALYDVESTGVDPLRDRIVTATIVRTTPDQTPRFQAASWLVSPVIDIPEAATRVHGITTEAAVASGVDIAGAAHEIADHLVALSRSGLPVVGHNVRYDLTMLWAELTRCGDPLADAIRSLRPVICTMTLDKWVDPWRPKAPTAKRPDPAKCGSRRLADTARVWGIPVDDSQTHGSEYDALLAGRLAWAIAQAKPGAAIPVGELHDALVGIAREQAESLGAWLTKQGRVDDVAREWPIQVPPHDWSPDQLPIQREDIPA